MTDSPAPRFAERLARIQRRWRWGHLLIHLLRVLGWALMALLLYGIIDAVFSLSSETRLRVNRLLIMGMVAAIIAGWIALLAPGLRRLAALMDRDTASARQPILSALDLSGSPAEDDRPFASFLREQSVAQGETALNSLAWKSTVPAQACKRQLGLLAGQAALLVAVIVLGGATARTTLARIAHPDRGPAARQPPGLSR